MIINKLENLTLADLQQIGELRPDLARFADFVLANTYDKFLEILHKDLQDCIESIEINPSVRQKDSEDRITEDVIGWLRARGYYASHDEQVGGHCDVVVRVRDKPFMWLGEAKKHSAYEDLQTGFNQLCTRYARGTPNNDNGGLIIYIYNEKATDVIAEWKKRLRNLELEKYYEKECDSRSHLSFYSTHTHQSSGLPYTVKHMGVVLHFKPLDR
ncbi:MAG: hypothetical protein HRU78_07955 [Gammaproteobacteria bacterium]|nr:MAG: hypothetical protein HRU78_07955 [Gammaproteobacteria bacterium]